MSAPKVLKNGTVITFSEEVQTVQILPKASILIKDGRIAAIEEDFDKLVIPTGAEIVDVQDKIICPGFVNTHYHAWITAFRGIAPNVTLSHYFGWLSHRGETASTVFTPEDVYISCLEGYLEGINGGVTTYVDHAHNNWHLEAAELSFNAILDSGVRAWWCFDPTAREGVPIEDQWKEYERITSKVPEHSIASIGLGYDGSVNASDEAFEQIKRRVKDHHISAITNHHLGGPWPAVGSSPSSLAKKGVASLNIPLIPSHAGFLTEDDLRTLRDHNMHISITPESEFHYGHGQSTSHQVSALASLGLDTNFTFSGDMLTQARMWLQKVRFTGYQAFLEGSGLLPRNTPMSVEQGFLLATRQGGRALWRDDLGVIKVGAVADVVVFNTESPNMLGASDAVAAVMLHANVGDIQHVMVDGKWRKWNFELVNLKLEWGVVRERFLDTARRVQEHARRVMPPVPVHLWEKPTGGSWRSIRLCEPGRTSHIVFEGNVP